MSNIQINATSIYAANVSETRAHFLAQEDALYEEWLNSNMSAPTFDSRRDALRASLAHYLNEEAKLYRLNLSNPL